MPEFGLQLKQARERRGISLRQIATSTKISIVALEALERDDFSRLPGGIFSRAFVRSYAIEVGLDPEETVNQFLVEFERAEADASKFVPAPEVTADDRHFLERQRKAARALKIGAIALGVLIVALIVAWKMSSVGQGQASASTPAPETAGPAAESSSGPPPATAPRAPAPAPAGPAAGLVVDLQMSSECWVQVTSDGKMLPQRLFGAGERQRFEADKVLLLQIGDAGAMTWTINGRPAKALGKSGEVKQVRLTRENIGEYVQ